MGGENWKDLWHRQCIAKRKAQTSTTKVAATQDTASQTIPKTKYGCAVEISRIHKATGGIFFAHTNTMIALQAKFSLR